MGRVALLGVAVLCALATVQPVHGYWITTALAITSPPALSTVSGLTTVSGTSSALDYNGDGYVVIAVLDTGINPYNIDFGLAAGQPTTHPSNYIQGYPSTVPALNLACAATTNIPGSCSADFAGVPTSLTNPINPATDMRWIRNTKIIAAVSFDAFGSIPILDENSHGTYSASVAVGNIAGTCPECLLVVVEGLGGEGLIWASHQPWIDITSNSYGMDFRCIAGVPPDPTCPVGVAGTVACYAACASDADVQQFVESGGSALFAAGNGNLDMFESPQETHLSPLTGPDFSFVVGAIIKDSDTSILGSGKPVTMSSYGLGDIPAACYSTRVVGVANSMEGCQHSGTSAATPQTAGVMGRILLQAKRMLGDGTEGPEGIFGGVGVASRGTPVLGNQYLQDGKLTRQELWAITTKTGQPLGGTPDPSYAPILGLPASNDDYAYAGYGIANPASRQLGIDTVYCGADLPAHSAADDFFVRDSQVRVQRWGSWAEPKFDRTIGTAGVPMCAGIPPNPMPPIVLKVNGISAGSTSADPVTGNWAYPIDFSLYPLDSNGQWAVQASYAGLVDTRIFVPAPVVITPSPSPPASGSSQGDNGVATSVPPDSTGDAPDDPDHDAVIDGDNCPQVNNARQQDLDGDGIGDACDPDSDGDAVLESGENADNCVGRYNPAGADGKQPDRDNDGVGDACDPDLLGYTPAPVDLEQAGASTSVARENVAGDAPTTHAKPLLTPAGWAVVGVGGLLLVLLIVVAARRQA